MKVPGYDVEGWPAIAEVLGVSTPYAQSLMKRHERRPPVRRYLSFLIAKRSELEAWLEVERTTPPPRRPSPPRGPSPRQRRQRARMRRASGALGQRFDVFGLDRISEILGCSRERAAVLARRAVRPAPAFLHRLAWVAVRADLERWLVEERAPAGELRGWRAIAEALGMSPDTVASLAARTHDPIPVERRTRGRRFVACAQLEELLAWQAREDARRRAEREPEGLVVGLRSVAGFCDMSQVTVLALAKRTDDPLPYRPGTPGTADRVALLAWLDREGRRRSSTPARSGLTRGRWAEHTLRADAGEGEELVGWVAICGFARITRARAARLDVADPFPVALERVSGRLRPRATRAAIVAWLERDATRRAAGIRAERASRAERARASPDELVGWREIGEVLGLAEPTLLRLAKGERPIPVTRRGRFVVATRADLTAWSARERRAA